MKKNFIDLNNYDQVLFESCLNRLPDKPAYLRILLLNTFTEKLNDTELCKKHGLKHSELKYYRKELRSYIESIEKSLQEKIGLQPVLGIRAKWRDFVSKLSRGQKEVLLKWITCKSTASGADRQQFTKIRNKARRVYGVQPQATTAPQSGEGHSIDERDDQEFIDRTLNNPESYEDLVEAMGNDSRRTGHSTIDDTRRSEDERSEGEDQLINEPHTRNEITNQWRKSKDYGEYKIERALKAAKDPALMDNNAYREIKDMRATLESFGLDVDTTLDENLMLKDIEDEDDLIYEDEDGNVLDLIKL